MFLNLNMSSLIANKLKTNICLVLIKLLLFASYMLLFRLDPHIQKYLAIRYSCLLTTFLQAITLIRLTSLVQIFKHATSLYTRLAKLPLLVCFILPFRILPSERSAFHLLENYIPITYFFGYCVHSACCCVHLRCVFVIYLFHLLST